VQTSSVRDVQYRQKSTPAENTHRIPRTACIPLLDYCKYRADWLVGWGDLVGGRRCWSGWLAGSCWGRDSVRVRRYLIKLEHCKLNLIYAALRSCNLLVPLLAYIHPINKYLILTCSVQLSSRFFPSPPALDCGMGPYQSLIRFFEGVLSGYND
jgi:hypothetical protein